MTGQETSDKERFAECNWSGKIFSLQLVGKELHSTTDQERFTQNDLLSSGNVSLIKMVRKYSYSLSASNEQVLLFSDTMFLILHFAISQFLNY